MGIVRNWVESAIDGFDPNPIYMYFNCCIHKSSYKKTKKKIKGKEKEKKKKNISLSNFFFCKKK